MTIAIGIELVGIDFILLSIAIGQEDKNDENEYFFKVMHGLKYVAKVKPKVQITRKRNLNKIGICSSKEIPIKNVFMGNF